MKRTSRVQLLALVLMMVTASCTVHRVGGTDAGAPNPNRSGDEVVDAGGNPALAPPTDQPAGTIPGGAAAPAASSGSSVPGGASRSGSPARVDNAPASRPAAVNVTSGVARTASDRGVTKDEIQLGILAIDEGFLNSGAVPGASQTKRHEVVMKPFIDEINNNGGINGRKVVPRVTRFDPLNVDNMQAACVQQAEDFKVFSSIATIGFYGEAEVCMARKQTPVLTSNNSSAELNYDREQGWVRQTAMNSHRNAFIWIDWMIATGRLKPTTKAAVLYTDVPEVRSLLDKVFVPYMKSKGLPEPIKAGYSASIAQTPAESQSIILNFRTKNVELVLPLVSYLRMQIFTNEAEAQAFHPAYSVNDFGLMATDATSGYPASQWTGVTGITVLNTGLADFGKPPNTQAFRDCLAVYKAGGQTLRPHASDPSRPEVAELINMTHYCQHLALWADAARRAGVNPTRKSLLAAFDATGTWDKRVYYSDRLTFNSKKYDGADLYQVVRWQPNCAPEGGCYKQIRGFQPGAH